MEVKIINYKTNKINYLSSVILLILSFGVFACGDSGDGGNSPASGAGVVDTGNVSKGVITNFGSVFVNGIRHDISASEKKLDDNDVPETEYQIGMKVELKLNRTTDATERIEYEPEVKGRVISTNVPANSMNIIGQTVIANSTTIFKGVQNISGISAGDNIEASGFFNSSGNLLATYIEREDAGLAEFKVKGVVSSLDSANKRFSINALTVNYTNVSNPPSINNGTFVEVQGSFDVPSNTLSALSLQIEDSFPGLSPEREVEIEGIVTSINPRAGIDFLVNGLSVALTDTTTFENGTRSDIDINVRVEVEGRVNSSSILVASKVQIKFKEDSDVRLDGNIESVNTVNSTINLLGKTVTVTVNTSFNDKVSNLRPFSINDIIVGNFVEVRGFQDSAGSIVAAGVERDNDNGEDSLRGPVTAETPNTGLTILGITVNVGGAGFEFEDENDNNISAGDFFARVNAGDIVQVEGTYTGGGILNANKAEIERDIN